MLDGSICWTIQRWFQGCTWRGKLKPPKFTRLSSAPKHFLKCLFINKNIYLACLAVCSFVSNKLQNNWTDYAQISCGTSRDPREVLRMIELKKNLLLSKFDFWKLVIFYKICKFLLVLFYNLFTAREVTSLTRVNSEL